MIYDTNYQKWFPYRVKFEDRMPGEWSASRATKPGPNLRMGNIKTLDTGTLDVSLKLHSNLSCLNPGSETEQLPRQQCSGNSLYSMIALGESHGYDSPSNKSPPAPESILSSKLAGYCRKVFQHKWLYGRVLTICGGSNIWSSESGYSAPSISPNESESCLFQES